MNFLAENALMIWVGGAVLLTLSGVVYSQLRTKAAFGAVLAVAVVTAALLAAERLIETPREAIARTLYELADAVEANDVPGALARIAPGASQIRGDIETAMPLVRIDKANVIGTPEISIDMSQRPPTASVACKGFVHATLRRNGMVGGDFAELVISFERDGDRWLVKDYTSNKDWRRAAAGGRP